MPEPIPLIRQLLPLIGSTPQQCLPARLFVYPVPGVGQLMLELPDHLPFKQRKEASRRRCLEQFAIARHVELVAQYNLPASLDFLPEPREPRHLFGNPDVHLALELHHGEGLRCETAHERNGNLNGAFVREAFEFGHVMPHEGGGEALDRAALPEGHNHELKAAVNSLKHKPSVLNAEESGDGSLSEQHLAQLLCAEIGVDAAGDDDAAVAAGAQQVEALLGEELVRLMSDPAFLPSTILI